ncbi:MAG: VanZ family protein [Gammaproteobacteria bacterium]|nr:VanZ family protein [Gammaproteobacteria bacterium]
MTSFLLTTRIVLTLCFLALLMLVSLIPGHPKPGDSTFIWLVANTPTLMQKVLHVCLYGVLALLLLWTFEGIQSRAYRFLISFILAVAFGAVMEWCQTKVPGRFGTVYDVALNAAGAALGLLAAAFLL